MLLNKQYEWHLLASNTLLVYFLHILEYFIVIEILNYCI